MVSCAPNVKVDYVVPSKRTSPRSKRLPLFASTYNVDFGFDCCGLLCRRNLLEAVPLQMPWRLQGPLVNTRRIMVEAWFLWYPFPVVHGRLPFETQAFQFLDTVERYI
jgi:hypothetical protein